MRTFDTPTSADRDWLTKLRTDALLLGRLIRMMISYSISGHRVRKLYRQAKTTGKTFWVDDPAETIRQLR